MDKIVCTEIDYILNQLDKIDLNKIPTKLLDYFRENKDINYNCSIDFSIPLEKQNLRPQTLDYLCALNYLYLSSTEQQKELYEIYEQNDKIIYNNTNVYNLLKHKKNIKNNNNINNNINNDINNDLDNNNKLISYQKYSFFKNIFNKIKYYLSNNLNNKK